jgi:hypothetical protein
MAKIIINRLINYKSMPEAAAVSRFTQHLPAAMRCHRACASGTSVTVSCMVSWQHATRVE